MGEGVRKAKNTCILFRQSINYAPVICYHTPQHQGIPGIVLLALGLGSQCTGVCVCGGGIGVGCGEEGQLTSIC